MKKILPILATSLILSAGGNKIKAANTANELSNALNIKQPAKQDSTKWINLSDKNLEEGKEFFNNSLSFNGDTLDISGISVNDSITVDIKNNHSKEGYKVIGKFGELDTKYAHKLDSCTISLFLDKVHGDNKTYVKINNMILENDEFDLTVSKDGKYIVLNDLLVFEKTGDVTKNPETAINTSITYDEDQTVNRIKESVSQMGFAVKLNKDSLAVSNKLMNHINIVDLVGNSFDLLTTVERTDDGIANWTRSLVVKDGDNFKKITDIKYTYDEDEIFTAIGEVPKTITTNINGFDVELKFETAGNDLTINIVNEKEFVEYLESLFVDVFELLNNTNLADKNVYENLNKILRKEKGEKAEYTLNPELLKLGLVKGISINIGSEDNPIIVHISKEGKLVFVDDYNKENTNTIELMDEKDKNIMRVMEIGDKGLNVSTQIGKTPGYKYIKFAGNGAYKLQNPNLNINQGTLEINSGAGKFIGEIPLEHDEKKGYSIELDNNVVELKAEYFYHLLPDVYKYKSNKIDLSDDAIKEKFKEEFDKVFAEVDDKKKIGVVLENMFFSLDTDNKDNTTAIINANVPEEVKEILDNIKDFIGYMIRISKAEYYFINDGKNIKPKSVSEDATPLFEYISGPYGMGVLSIEGFDDFDAEEKNNKITVKLRDGYGKEQELEFNVSKKGPELEDSTIKIGDTDYKVKYEGYGDCIYVVPTKK